MSVFVQGLRAKLGAGMRTVILGLVVWIILAILAITCAHAGGTFQVIPGLDRPRQATPYVSPLAVDAWAAQHQSVSPFIYRQEEPEYRERVEHYDEHYARYRRPLRGPCGWNRSSVRRCMPDVYRGGYGGRPIGSRRRGAGGGFRPDGHGRD